MRICIFLTALVLAAGCLPLPVHAEELTLADCTKSYSTLPKGDLCEGGQALLTFDLMVNQIGCVITPDKMEWSVTGTAETSYAFGTCEEDLRCKAYCLITAESAGTVCVKGTEKDGQYGTKITDVYWNLTVNEDGSFDAERIGHSAPVRGDISGDGIFDTADAALFQRYLTGVPETRLADWHTADLNGDGILSASDLSIMKQELRRQQISEAVPQLMILDCQITLDSTGWGSKFYVKIIDDHGIRYTQEFAPREYYDHPDAAYWSDMAEQILWDGQQTALTAYPETVTAFTRSAAQYQNCDTVDWGFSVSDWGTETLYALYPDETGTVTPLALCTFGENCTWLDNAAVQEFTAELIRSGCYADADIFEFYMQNK